MAIVDSYNINMLYDDTFGFRRISGNPYNWDVQQYERLYLSRVVRGLYYVSPIVRKIIDKPIMLFFENGLNIFFKDKLLENSFNEYVNNFEYSFSFSSLVEMFIKSLMIDGELFVPIIERENGFIEFGFIPSESVIDVISNETNGLIFDKIKYGKPKTGYDKHIISAYDEPVERSICKIKKRNGKYVRKGEVFYFSTNNMPFMRGRSLIETIMDFAYAYDEFTLDRIRRSKVGGMFVWDVLMKGATQEQLEEREQKMRMSPIPNSGGILFHNENEEWEPKSVQLTGEEAKTDKDIILSHIAAGNNLLTKEEIGLDIQSEQENELVARYVQYIVNTVFVNVIDKLVQSIIISMIEIGIIPEDIDTEYKIYYAKYFTTMKKEISIAFNQMVNALKVARERGWVNDKDAREIVSEIINNMPDYERISDNKRRINLGELNSTINTLGRAIDLKLITVEDAKNIIQKYANMSEYEWIGGNVESRYGGVSSSKSGADEDIITKKIDKNPVGIKKNESFAGNNNNENDYENYIYKQHITNGGYYGT